MKKLIALWCIVAALSVLTIIFAPRETHVEKKISIVINRGTLYINGKQVKPDSADFGKPFKGQKIKRDITYYTIKKSEL